MVYDRFEIQNPFIWSGILIYMFSCGGDETMYVHLINVLEFCNY
jgi:hypothetical protein